jgi:hypothetical protein
VKYSPISVHLRIIYHNISVGLSYTNQHFLRRCLKWILDLFFESCVKKCQQFLPPAAARRARHRFAQGVALAGLRDRVLELLSPSTTAHGRKPARPPWQQPTLQEHGDEAGDRRIEAERSQCEMRNCWRWEKVNYLFVLPPATCSLAGLINPSHDLDQIRSPPCSSMERKSSFAPETPRPNTNDLGWARSLAGA